MAVQPDGKIVVVGTAGAFPDEDLLVARYTQNGILDQQFGVNEKVIVDVRAVDQAYAVVLQPDGKIVVAGFTTGVNGDFLEYDGDYLILRFNTDGTPDLTFGNAGQVVTSFIEGATSRFDFAVDVAVQQDGKIIAGARRRPSCSRRAKVLHRSFHPSSFNCVEAGARNPCQVISVLA